MFIPLHDQNNEPVASIQSCSYVIALLTFLVFLYQTILAFGNPTEYVLFTLRHGLVPAPIFAGNPDFTVEIKHPVSKTKSKAPVAEKEHSPPEPEMKFTVTNSFLSLVLSPLTYIFLHGGWLHLIGNLWFFWIFSDNVEERLGPVLFSFFYLVPGVAGGLLHALLNASSTIPLVGASGAISGIMGAYVVMFPGNRITSYFCPIWFFIRRIDVPAWMVLGFYILINLASQAKSEFLGAGVAFDCHIGGFLTGALIAFLFKSRVQRLPV